MEEGVENKMSANPKRIRINPDMQPILEESANEPLIVEAGDSAYRINAQRIMSDEEIEESIINANDPLLRFVGVDTS